MVTRAKLLLLGAVIAIVAIVIVVVTVTVITVNRSSSSSTVGKKVTFPSKNELGDGQGVLIGDPKTTPRGLIVIHEVWGMNEQIQEQGARIAKEGGFTVLVPDMYRKVAKDREEARHYRSRLAFDAAAQDISAGAKYLISLGCRKVGVMGFCMGGALSFAAAVLSQNISAAAPFYGIPNNTQSDLLQIRIPVQSHFGELDTAVGFSSPADYNALNKSLADAGVPHEMHTYPAGHGFTNVNNQNYNPEATKLAMSRVYEFMRLHLAEGEKVTFPSENSLGDGQGVLIGDPKTTPRGLIVIHEIWGMNEQIREQGSQIAKEGGFTVLVPDMYRGKVTKDIGEARHFMSGLDWNGAAEDISAGAKYLISLGCRKVGVMGFCMGGALSFAAAVLSQNISAAAPFYGIPNKTVADLLQIRIPVQSHFGELDTAVGFSSPAEYNALNETLANTGVPHEMYTYHAGHGFTNVNSQRYSSEATKLAMSRVYEFMQKHL